ncbi:MAG: SAF domain-containing protein, partial [Mycobacteriales bacterium]
LAPAPPPTLRVLAAVHELGPGVQLTAADVALVAVPTSLAPQGVLTSLTQVVGRVVAGRVRRGEALTDVRLLGSGLVQDRGMVAAPVRLADPATAALLHAGDRVDVLAAPSGVTAQAVATTVARDLRVLAVPVSDDDDGALVVLAAPPGVAARLAGAGVASRLSVTVLPS